MAGKKHLQPSRLVELLPKEAICRCGKGLLSKDPVECPLNGVPPSEGDGMCRCCPSCRNKCFEEI